MAVAQYCRLARRCGVLPKLGSATLLLILLVSVVDYPARTPIIMAMATHRGYLAWGRRALMGDAMGKAPLPSTEPQPMSFFPVPVARVTFPHMRKICLVLLGAAALAGCAHPGALWSRPASSTVVQDSAALPAPERRDLTAADRQSLIGPLDTIQIDVFNVPDLSREVQVDAGGQIAMPLIGTIDARGRTAQELAQTIESALRGRYVRNPDVTVNIKSSVSQVVTIDGQVTEPGLYPVTNQMTLLRAIASAKGLSEFAKQDDVVILRTVDGRKMAGLYNIDAIRRGAYTDPAIYANDVVVVGDSPARRRFRDIVSLAPLLAAPTGRDPELRFDKRMNVLTSNLQPQTAIGEVTFVAYQSMESTALPLIQQYLRIALRWKYVIIGVTIACVVLGLVVTLLMTPKYTATATVEIAREASQVTNIQEA